ncbi:hypothetical protein P175DRAFT_0454989 [Aspergillus ochraceoroseus IBT 24754]|nr:uncharacterized protein P175DRAFT_0454989 [Aspergillus ochraceoroseus IBT 24754]PTU23336.1 hypothetical protein P175DRAFT_0454989 [Aspergillus ochraceoroseus IBT 24754]
MPEPSTRANHEGIGHWLSISAHHSALHSAMLFGSYSHRRVRWLVTGHGQFGADNIRYMRICEADTISKINRAIQDPLTAVSDAIILSVLCLAANYHEDRVSQLGKLSPFQAPLRSLQWLDIYGRLSTNAIHQAGLIQLIQLKGGLEKIELPALAAVISFFGIINASKTLSRPYFPFSSLQDGRELTLHHVLYTPIPTWSYQQGSLLQIPMTNEMLDVFHGLRKYVSLVQAFQDGVQPGVDRGTLCDFRNLLQWHIMSLLPASQLGHVIIPFYPMYESCRLALIIFGVGITFPLPPETAPLEKLSKMLQIELESCDYSSLSGTPGATEIRCWCLVLGGIASTETNSRKWFVQQLRRIATAQGLSTWDEVKVVLESTVWVERACDMAGSFLWDEVMILPNSEDSA